jgi:hypothetical protein
VLGNQSADPLTFKIERLWGEFIVLSTESSVAKTKFRFDNAANSGVTWNLFKPRMFEALHNFCNCKLAEIVALYLRADGLYNWRAFVHWDNSGFKLLLVTPDWALDFWITHFHCSSDGCSIEQESPAWVLDLFQQPRHLISFQGCLGFTLAITLTWAENAIKVKFIIEVKTWPRKGAGLAI